MALNIKNAEVEQLATEVAAVAGESTTEAIRKALQERRTRLKAQGKRHDRAKGLRQYLEQEVWPFIPKEELGRVMTRQEEDDILGNAADEELRPQITERN